MTDNPYRGAWENNPENAIFEKYTRDIGKQVAPEQSSPYSEEVSIPDLNQVDFYLQFLRDVYSLTPNADVLRVVNSLVSLQQYYLNSEGQVQGTELHSIELPPLSIIQQGSILHQLVARAASWEHYKGEHLAVIMGFEQRVRIFVQALNHNGRRQDHSEVSMTLPSEVRNDGAYDRLRSSAHAMIYPGFIHIHVDSIDVLKHIVEQTNSNDFQLLLKPNDVNIRLTFDRDFQIGQTGVLLPQFDVPVIFTSQDPINPSNASMHLLLPQVFKDF